MKKNEVLTAIEERKERSAWKKAVSVYAYELVEGLEAEEVPSEKEALKKLLLNGADSWKDFSYGGCSLIYDGDIAERTCTPSELKKKKGGELQPGYGRTWLDVQARALAQAYLLIYSIVK